MPDLSASDAGEPPAGEPERRAVVRDSLGVGVAVGVSGLTFGAAGSSAGLSVLQCCVMSLLVFTGASQFALIGVLGGGGAPLAGAASALALGIRNSFYGIRLASLLRLRGPRRAVLAQVVTDESTAMTLAQPTRASRRLAFVVTGLTLYVVWNLATLLGAVAVEAVGDPNALGIDAAVPAAFLALVAPRLKEPEQRRTAAVAVVLALAAVPFTPVGVPVLIAAAAVLPALLPTPAERPSQ